ncbi:MAG: hypothetical protein NPIRA01_18580 [Nitrospirales bacterium]|nr:MAG: hypothetical protein NPIRA01_18580 [Nitrospirales bacterium]
MLLDGRSIRIVLQEVFKVYESFLEQRYELDVPEPRPFADFIQWLGDQTFINSETFWRNNLNGFATPTPIPLAGPSLHQQPRVYKSTEEQVLSLEVTSSLEHFSHIHHITLNTLIQGAWAILLSRYSGEDDVVFGVTRACRKSSLLEADGMVGLFINSLPFRVQISPHQLLLPWLKSIRAFNVELREYEHTPLSHIHSWSEVNPGLPLFETLVVFENYDLDTALRSQGGRWLQRKFEYFGQTNFPLTLIVSADRQLLMNVEYDPMRFEKESIQQMLKHMEILLTGMMGNSSGCVLDIPMLTSREQDFLLTRHHSVLKPVVAVDHLHGQFEKQVQETPAAIAVTYEQEHLTYWDLNIRANQLAHYLIEQGVQSGTFVALAIERSLSMLIGILGILKAGGAYVPVDPQNPQERILFILDDVKAPFVLTSKQTEIDFSGIQTQVIRMEDAQGEISECCETNPCVPLTHEDLAYIIFTSGSTGNPKGVMVSHANVSRLFRATQDWFGFNENDVWTLFHSYAFDFSVWEIWGAWLHGGRLVIVPYWVSRSPELFYDLLLRERVTVLNQTPTAFTQLIQVDQSKEKREGPALRFIIFGGEKLEFHLLLPWVDRYGDQHPQLVNMYGITETTVHVTYRPIYAEECRSSSGKSLIGRPLPDLQIHLLDKYRRLVPVGVPGEMYIGGEGVARGYLNQSELTRERFFFNPFSRDSRSYLYKSGDLARCLLNGDIEYLGRSDRQVKIRGFRIELGEIEAALFQIPCVRQAVVLLDDDGVGEKRLVAYLELGDVITPDLGEVNEFLNHRLPGYMVPSLFVVLKEIPLTVNGKLDRHALAQSQGIHLNRRRGRVAPRSQLEQDIVLIYQGILGVAEISIHDNFFELGGNSISAFRVITSLRSRFGIDVQVISLFEYPTIAKLVQFISSDSQCRTLKESSDLRAKRQREARTRFQRIPRNKPI